MKLGIVLASATIVVGTTGIASAALMSDYTLVPPGNLDPPAVYALSTHSNEYRGDGAWGDYTAPNGAGFYVINGAITPDARVFYEDNVSLTAGDIYSVTFLAVDNYPVSAPVLQLSDDGVLVGNAVTLTGPYGSSYPSGVGPWQKYTLSFTAASGGLHTLGLIDTNTDFSGNDFSLAAVPEPSTWAMMLLGFAGLGFAGYRGAKRKASIPA